ncbi:hypothetical protein [Salinimicrobium sp. GXAS 041]|uniref:hypothetical protein n=1 Tax=Salinimicrobium sp. GXAS 041 TaxID=3400806 RepID=UPI003C795EA7
MRLPLNPDLVQLNEKAGLNDKYRIINENTGEEKPYSPKQKKAPIIVDGVKYVIYTQLRHINGVTNNYLYCHINSHQLKEKYMEGVTLDNAPFIYSDIMQLNIFRCSYDTFLNRSYCTDIDLKRDRIITDVEFTQIKKQLRTMTMPTKNNKGYQNYGNGVVWNTRRGANSTNPNVKIYDKSKHLDKECKEFQDKHLVGQDLTNIKRLEYNIKDRKHLERLGLPATHTSLKHILSLTNQQKNMIERKILNQVLDLKNIPSTSKPAGGEIKGNDIVIKNYILTLIDDKKELTYPQIVDVASNGLEDKTRKRFIDKWLKLYDHFKYKYEGEKKYLSTIPSKELKELLNLGKSA